MPESQASQGFLEKGTTRMAMMNPMGRPEDRLPTDAQSVEFIRNKLAELLVDQTGVAKAIVVDIDPSTGERAFNFHVDKASRLAHTIAERDIRGIPVRFTEVDA
jgi:hypothetical protein